MSAGAPGSAGIIGTGESAVLVRLNDGQITGGISFKVYRPSGLSGDLPAIIDTDPRKLPPDHGALKPTNDPRADWRPDALTKRGEISNPAGQADHHRPHDALRETG
jgi:hypothetical protein